MAGRMLTRNDGAVPTFRWNDENRLVRLQGPGGLGVVYTYDSVGRMLTRDDGGPDITQLTWLGWNCIKEVTGESETVYHIPKGQILSFTRDGERFDCHFDALQSVRMVTNENGDVVLRKEFGAFGGELAGGIDGVPGGFTYGFVGAAGCRKDPSISLVYMRQRWYDSGLGRFVSRDPIGIMGGANAYLYAGSNPANRIDPSGLKYRFLGKDVSWNGTDFVYEPNPQAVLDFKTQLNRAYGGGFDIDKDGYLILPPGFKATDKFSQQLLDECGEERDIIIWIASGPIKAKGNLTKEVKDAIASENYKRGLGSEKEGERNHVIWLDKAVSQKDNTQLGAELTHELWEAQNEIVTGIAGGGRKWHEGPHMFGQDAENLWLEHVQANYRRVPTPYGDPIYRPYP